MGMSCQLVPYLPMCLSYISNKPAGADPGLSWRPPKPSLLLKTDPRSINPSPSTYFCVFFLFSSGSYWKSSVWVLVCSVWTVVVCQSGRPGQLLSAPITSLGRVCVTVHPLLASVHQAWLCSSGVYLHTAGSQTVAEVPTGVLVGFSDRSSRKWVKVKLQ